MKSRIPLTVAVVGALLVGGAATGTTLASWTDAQPQPSSAVQAGTIGLTVNGQTHATFTAVPSLALNSGATPGTAHTFNVPVVNTGTGKNLRVRMYVDDVTTTQTDLSNGLEVSVVGASSADTCPAPTYAALSATNNVELTTTAVGPGGTRTLCVAVRVKANAATATGGKTGDLVFSLRSQQVYP